LSFEPEAANSAQCRAEKGASFPDKPARLPPELRSPDATITEVMAYRRRSERTVFRKLEKGVYRGHKNPDSTLVTWESAFADRERCLAQGRAFGAGCSFAAAGSSFARAGHLFDRQRELWGQIVQVQTSQSFEHDHHVGRGASAQCDERLVFRCPVPIFDRRNIGKFDDNHPIGSPIPLQYFV
jgi:hypothetical protein